MAEKRRYPIGLQTFEDVVNQNCVYVDKTEYVYKMASSPAQNFFLSRPCRFGKSLLVSTMKAYFEGRKELFKGLAIEKLEKDWIKYPVIHLDLSRGDYNTFNSSMNSIDFILREQEWRFCVSGDNKTGFCVRMVNLIRNAFEKCGRRVVVLIDSYDAPILLNIHNEPLIQQLLNPVYDFLYPLKSQSDIIHKLLITGSSKYLLASEYRAFNHLVDITMSREYESICGITESELITQMKPDIEWLEEQTGRTYDETVEELKHHYGGYHFSTRMTDIFNPWSLINAFENGKIDDNKFSPDTAAVLVNVLCKNNIAMPELEGMKVMISSFNAPSLQVSDLLPMLFQNGCLTLKGYNPEIECYTLGFPNHEVKTGFAECLHRSNTHSSKVG